MPTPTSGDLTPAANPAFQLLERLVRVPGRERGEALAALLPEATRQPFRPFYRRRGRSALNLIVGDPRPSVVIGAHHDIDPHTIEGATDNTAAVAVLATLAREWLVTGFPPGLALCFWDLEEPGNGGFADGSSHYARALRQDGHRPDFAVVVDVVGLGIPWLSTRSAPSPAAMLRAACAPLGLPFPELATPGSDDAGLRDGGIPSALLTTLPASGSRWGWRVMHTPDDAIDQVDPGSVALMHATLDTCIRQTVGRLDGLATTRAAAAAEVAARRAASTWWDGDPFPDARDDTVDDEAYDAGHDEPFDDALHVDELARASLPSRARRRRASRPPLVGDDRQISLFRDLPSTEGSAATPSPPRRPGRPRA